MLSVLLLGLSEENPDIFTIKVSFTAEKNMPVPPLFLGVMLIEIS